MDAKSCSFVHRGQCKSDRGSLRLLVQTGGAGLLSSQPPVSVQWGLPGVCQQTRWTAAAFWGCAPQTARTSVWPVIKQYLFYINWNGLWGNTWLWASLILFPVMKNRMVSCELPFSVLVGFTFRCPGLSLQPEHYLRAWLLVGTLLTKQQRWVGLTAILCLLISGICSIQYVVKE